MRRPAWGCERRGLSAPATFRKGQRGLHLLRVSRYLAVLGSHDLKGIDFKMQEMSGFNYCLCWRCMSMSLHEPYSKLLKGGYTGDI